MSVQFGLGAPPGKVLRPHSPLGTAKFQFNSGYPDQQVWCSDSTKRRQRLGSGLIPDTCSTRDWCNGSTTGFQPVGTGSCPISRSRLSRPTGRVAPLKTGKVQVQILPQPPVLSRHYGLVGSAEK